MAVFNISIGDHYISYDSSYPNPNTFITFNCPPEIVITAKVAEVVSEVVQLIFDPATVGFKLADFPAVFFHICHGTQQAVVTPYRAYQNV